MERFVKSHENSVLFKLNKTKGHPAIKDKELKLIDALIDDRLVNKLLSYRKFCGDDKTYKATAVYGAKKATNQLMWWVPGCIP